MIPYIIGQPLQPLFLRYIFSYSIIYFIINYYQYFRLVAYNFLYYIEGVNKEIGGFAPRIYPFHLAKKVYLL